MGFTVELAAVEACAAVLKSISEGGRDHYGAVLPILERLKVTLQQDDSQRIADLQAEISSINDQIRRRQGSLPLDDEPPVSEVVEDSMARAVDSR